jgi:hypothetical protein
MVKDDVMSIAPWAMYQAFKRAHFPFTLGSMIFCLGEQMNKFLKKTAR